jgi:hypothetical protein
MLVRLSPSGSPGYAAGSSAVGIHAAPSLPGVPSDQPPTNGAGQASCPGCGSPGSVAGNSAAPSLSIAPSNQPPTNGGGLPSCPDCGNLANENVGAESMGIAVAPVSFHASPSFAAEANAPGSTYGGAKYCSSR